MTPGGSVCAIFRHMEHVPARTARNFLTYSLPFQRERRDNLHDTYGCRVISLRHVPRFISISMPFPSLSLSLSLPLSRVPPFTIFSLAPPLPLSRVSSELFLVTTTRHGLRKYSVSVPLASISIRLFRVPFSLLKQRVLVFDRAARFTWQRGGNLPRPAIKVGYETRTVLICQNTQNACRQTLPPPARFFSQTRGLCFTLRVIPFSIRVIFVCIAASLPMRLNTFSLENIKTNFV